MKKRLVIFASISVILAGISGSRIWEHLGAQNTRNTTLPSLLTDEAEIKWRYERAKEESSRAGGNSMTELMQQQAAEEAQIKNWHMQRKNQE